MWLYSVWRPYSPSKHIMCCLLMSHWSKSSNIKVTANCIRLYWSKRKEKLRSSSKHKEHKDAALQILKETSYVFIGLSSCWFTSTSRWPHACLKLGLGSGSNFLQELIRKQKSWKMTLPIHTLNTPTRHTRGLRLVCDVILMSVILSLSPRSLSLLLDASRIGIWLA